MTDNMRHEIPAFLSHLKKFNGYPVPFTQVWIDDKPITRQVKKKHLSCGPDIATDLDFRPGSFVDYSMAASARVSE